MPDPIVGIDTILSGDLPEQAANYGSLAVFAAKTEEDWRDELTTTEENRWNNGIIAGLYDGLEQGKPFVTALIQAIIHKVFDNVTEVFSNVNDAFENMLSNFSGKWRDILAAQDAADFANAQLAAINRLISDLFDGGEGDLSANWTVTYTSGSGLAAGKIQMDGRGNAWWDGFGGLYRIGTAIYNAMTTTTDYQVVSTVMPLRVQDPKLGSDSWTRLIGRSNTAGTEYVFGEIGNDTAAIGYRYAGTDHVLQSVSTATSNGDSWEFRLGSSTSDDQFVLKRNGVVIVDTSSSATSKGSDYRSVGFAMRAGDRNLFLSQTSPGKMAVFSADDQ